MTVTDTTARDVPSSSVAPLSSLPAPHTQRRVVDVRDSASRTDWKDLLLALCSGGSILLLAAQQVGELPGTSVWQLVVGIVAPLVLLVVRRLRGHGPRAWRSSSITPARVGILAGVGGGVWLLWLALSERDVVAGLAGLVALGVGAALDRRARTSDTDEP